MKGSRNTPRDPLTPGRIHAIGELEAAGLGVRAIAQRLRLAGHTVRRGQHVVSWLRREGLWRYRRTWLRYGPGEMASFLKDEGVWPR